MSDFLSNLIARSFADNSAIRPRLASLFESPAAGPFTEAQAETPTRAADQTAVSTLPTSTDPKKMATGKPETERPAMDAAVSSSAEQQTWHPNEPKTPVEPVVIPPHSPDKNIELSEKKKIVPTIAAFDGKNHGHNAKTESFQESLERPAFRSRRQNSSPTVEPRPSPPVIQVTIGRVEVRAIQSAVPAPKPSKPAPPKLSLDDYLQKRDGGSR